MQRDFALRELRKTALRAEAVSQALRRPRDTSVGHGHSEGMALYGMRR
jgi:hypothetical protein